MVKHCLLPFEKIVIGFFFNKLKGMLDINRILKTEFLGRGSLLPKQAEYLLKKFLLHKGIYKEFVEEYLKYQNRVYEPKKVIERAVNTLTYKHEPFYDIIQRYNTAFEWSKTLKGEKFWLDIHNQWHEITSKELLHTFYVENSQ